jgi:hypothetical protein
MNPIELPQPSVIEMYFIPLFLFLIRLNGLIFPILLSLFIWFIFKKRRKALIIISALLVLSVGIIYLTQLKPHCEYKGGNKLVEDYRGMNQQEITNRGGANCWYPVTTGNGFTRMAPILGIRCGETKKVCGQPVSCECLFDLTGVSVYETE